MASRLCTKCGKMMDENTQSMSFQKNKDTV